MPPKHDIYPVFLPHAGCPFQCIYCNQHAVAGASHSPDPVSQAATALGRYGELIGRTGRAGEIAFYGGTFTALPRPVLERILEMAAGYVSQGIFTGIRFSTRPDCLESDTCRVLSGFPVRTVELGVQSLSDEVLARSGRGYTAEVVFRAAEQVRNHGWSLGIQLMAGLPGDSAATFSASVRRAIEIGPDFFRFYPTLVVEGTRLAALFRDGAYRPLDLEDAIGWVASAYDMAVNAAIPVIRMGLHSDPALQEPGVILGGPFHPAFGYLVRCRWWKDRIDRELALSPPPAGADLLLRVEPRSISEIVGPGRSNISYWKTTWKLRDIRAAAIAGLADFQICVERDHRPE